MVGLSQNPTNPTHEVPTKDHYVCHVKHIYFGPQGIAEMVTMGKVAALSNG